jgi:phage-related baseplate assembly protein
VTCTQVGTVGNGYAIGQINRLYGGFAGVDACTNTAPTQGGRDEMSDDEYRAYLKDKLNSFSVAGPRSGYEYVAKSADERISEVCVVTPSAGAVDIYALIDDGVTPASLAPSSIKTKILAACNADTARPLTDSVSVKDGGEQTYSIEFTYYVRSDVTLNSAEIAAVLNQAISDYQIWQAAKFGRDINPSKLTQMLMDTGLLTRVNITHPVYTELNDGSDGNAPEHARCTSSIGTNGGVENA